MIAYNNEWLGHLDIRKQAAEAFDADCLTKDELTGINNKYPVGFYTPNIFIRIGLFVLTIIIMLFSLGLLALIFHSALDENLFSGLTIFFAILCYVALEYMVRTKNHYCSGVDDGLLWGASVALFCAISLPYDLSGLTNCLIIFMISLGATLRYADKLMAAVAYFSLAGIFFYACVESGSIAKAIAPFIIMVVSLAIYLAVTRSTIKKNNPCFTGCLKMIEISALISLYAAGNYYAVRELSNSMFNLNLLPGDSIPFGWLFWVFTILIPVIYLARGIQKKDAVLMRVGLILFAAIVFTVRYYHTILPLEIVMTFGGIVLLIISYGLMKWLHEPVHGFTSREVSSKNATDKLQIESLIIAQTFKPDSGTEGTQFGGGSTGGGGASGEY